MTPAGLKSTAHVSWTKWLKMLMTDSIQTRTRDEERPIVLLRYSAERVAEIKRWIIPETLPPGKVFAPDRSTEEPIQMCEDYLPTNESQFSINRRTLS